MPAERIPDRLNKQIACLSTLSDCTNPVKERNRTFLPFTIISITEPT